MFDSWLIIVRGLHIGSCLLIFGFWFFELILVRGLQFFPEDGLGNKVILRRAMYFLWPGAFVSLAGWFFLAAVNMGGLSPGETWRGNTLSVVWSQTEFGRVWQIHSWCGLAACLSTICQLAPLGRSGRGHWMARVHLFLLTAFVGTLAWAGHGLVGTSFTARWHPWVDAGHLVISGIWPAGLLPLVLVLPKMRGAPAGLALIQRFSLLSLISVGLLVVSGLINSWILVGSWSNLFLTGYGRLLLAKLALFAGAILLGADNRFRLKASGPGGLVGIYYRLYNHLWWEVALSAAIIVVVAILGMMAPAE